MLVREAREIGRRWVMEEAASIPGFRGAYFAGSANWLPDEAVFPAASDLDINAIVDGSEPPDARRKIAVDGLLVELSPLPLSRFTSPEQVLSDYHLAPGFASPRVILDPSGRLTELAAAVSRAYPLRQWVQRRCDHAQAEVLGGLPALDQPESFPDAAMGWLFATGRTTHMLLVVGLQNPTVRRRYAAVRLLLEEYDFPEFHQTLLNLLGAGSMTRAQVEGHLEMLEEVFDIAAGAIRSPFPFAADISASARPFSIEGSRELIERGLHREAMFWIAVTYARCRLVLAADAPAGTEERFEPEYRRLLGDLGIGSSKDLAERGQQVRARLGDVRKVANAIMAANPAIEGWIEPLPPRSSPLSPHSDLLSS